MHYDKYLNGSSIPPSATQATESHIPFPPPGSSGSPVQHQHTSSVDIGGEGLFIQPSVFSLTVSGTKHWFLTAGVCDLIAGQLVM